MSKETYNIPTSPTARFDYQRNAVETCTANAGPWKISADRLTKIAPLRADYETKFAVTNNPSTQSPSATAARDAAWALYEVALIDLYDHDILNNENIPADGKDALHIHYTSSGGGSSSPTPTTTLYGNANSRRNISITCSVCRFGQSEFAFETCQCGFLRTCL